MPNPSKSTLAGHAARFSMAALAISLLAPVPAPAKSQSPARVDYYEAWTAERGGSAASVPGLSARNAVPNETMLTFQAYGRQFQLLLQDNSELVRGVARQRPSLLQIYRFYKGRLPESPISWARLMQQGDQWRGMIWDGAEMYVIEPSAEVAALLSNPLPDPKPAQVIYRLSDTIADLGPDFCAAPGLPRVLSGTTGAVTQKTALSAYRALIGQINLAPTGGRQIDVGLIEDFEFAGALGTAADTRALSYMQIVDGIFSAQVGVHIAVASITAFTDANEPFTAFDSKDLLCQVGNYKFSQPRLRADGIAHLFTGRNMNGTTVGIAYTGSICTPTGHDTQNCGNRPIDFASSLSEGLRDGTVNGSSYPISALIAAHEIGHNFGAVHDGEAGNICAGTPQNFLMAPKINGSAQFSQCSLNSIAANVSGVSCLKAYNGGVVNLGLRAIAPKQVVLLDSTADIAIVVDSNGGATANGGQLAIDLSGGIALDSLSAAGATCTIGAGGGNCTLPSLASATSLTVSARIKGTALGAGQLTATVSAPGDSNPSDDRIQTSFDVQAGADLGLRLSAKDSSIARGASTELTATVTNASSSAATATRLSLTLPAGLTVTPAAPCASASGGLQCDLGTLAGNASSDIKLTVTGRTDGVQTIAGTVISTLPDPNPSNNSAQVNISVTAPSAPPPAAASSGKSGGGALDELTLGLLGLAIGLRCCLARARGPLTRSP